MVEELMSSQARIRRVMQRSLEAARSQTELLNEIKEVGAELPPGSLSRKDLENVLMRFYWQQENPGTEPPEFFAPMTLRKFEDLKEHEQEKIWKSPEWYFEKKRNGIRCLWYIGLRNEFRSRNISVKTFLPGDQRRGMFWLDKPFPELEGTVLDGEVISTKARVDTSSFVTGGKGTITEDVLQAVNVLLKAENARAFQEANGLPLRYIVYDLIKYKGQSMQGKPYIQRRQALAEVMATILPVVGDKVQLNEAINIDKMKLYEEYVSGGGEGGVLKHQNAPYEPGVRTKKMLKVKKIVEIDAVITGWTHPEEAKYINAGLIGGLTFSAKDLTDGKWYEVASVSSLSDEARARYSVKNPDGTVQGIIPSAYDEIWEIEGHAWTKNVKLAHAKMVRPRHQAGPDQKAKDECTFDRLAILERTRSQQTARVLAMAQSNQEESDLEQIIHPGSPEEKAFKDELAQDEGFNSWEEMEADPERQRQQVEVEADEEDFREMQVAGHYGERLDPDFVFYEWEGKKLVRRKDAKCPSCHEFIGADRVAKMVCENCGNQIPPEKLP